MDGFIVADEKRLDEILQTLADRVAAAFGERLTVVGIRRRGVPLARRLVELLEERGAGTGPAGEIELKRYADDLTLLHRQPRLAEESLSVDVDGATVMLVDDVLYTGRTLLRASGFLLEAGAERIHCAVLCVRDEPEVPVSARFTGMRLDVGSDNVIEVHIPPYEDDTAVALHSRDELS